jgi:hypothetical protein
LAPHGDRPRTAKLIRPGIQPFRLTNDGAPSEQATSDTAATPPYHRDFETMHGSNSLSGPLPETDLRKALAACRQSFFSAGFFSLFINLLLLLPSIYMMQVYDRVLASSSESTLVMLTLIAIFLYLVMGGLEWLRAQILIVTSNLLDQILNGRVFNAMFTQA